MELRFISFLVHLQTPYLDFYTLINLFGLTLFHLSLGFPYFDKSVRSDFTPAEFKHERYVTIQEHWFLPNQSTKGYRDAERVQSSLEVPVL